MLVYEGFMQAAEKFRNKPALKVKNGGAKFRDINYSELGIVVTELAAGLHQLIEKGKRIALISDNRPEWLYADLACLAIGAVDVPRRTKLDDSELEFIVSDSGARIAFVEDRKQLERLKKLAPQIETFIVLDEAFKSSIFTRAAHEFSLEDIIQNGRDVLGSGRREEAFNERLKSIKPEELATIIYTSGTSGTPKGVMLSQGNLAHNLFAVPAVVNLNSSDTFLSVLPLEHVFEREVQYVALSLGASIAYSSPASVKKDFKTVKPTFMASVPRIWESVYESADSQVRKSGGLKLKLFNYFINVGKKYIRAKDIIDDNLPEFSYKDRAYRMANQPGARLNMLFLSPLYNLGNILVYSKIRNELGGALRGAVSGSAGLPANVDEFFRVINIPVLEGYGLTETTAGVTIRTFESNIMRTAGQPLPKNKMEVISDDRKILGPGEEGEIIVSGPGVMMGYWNNPAETNKTLIELDGETWLRTGDRGMFDTKKNLRITGRIKNLFKLLNGDYVPPEPIEEALRQSPYISYAVCTGPDRKFIGVLISPNYHSLLEYYVNAKGLTTGPVVELLHSPSDAVLNERILRKSHLMQEVFAAPEVTVLYEKEIAKYASANPVYARNGISTCFVLLEKPFELGKEITYTLKVKQQVVFNMYAAEIEKMHAPKSK